MQAPVMEIQRGRHFYQFYKGREDLLRVVIPFLYEGLVNGEACLWLVSQCIGVLPAIEIFQRQHDILHYFEKGQLLVLPAERWYLQRGRFSGEKALQKLHQFIEERKKLGFVTFRGAGDGAWYEERDWPKIRAYEKKVHEWIPLHNVSTVCAYPISRCSITQTKDVLDHHHGVYLTRL